MARTANVHNNAQRLALLPATAIAGNVTVVGTPVVLLSGMTYVAVQANFTYDAGGGTVAVYIQTSLDGGVTWIDLIEFAFTTASLRKLASVSIFQTSASPYAPITAADGALTASTSVPGILGDRIRAKFVSASTVYSGLTSLQIDALAKG